MERTWKDYVTLYGNIEGARAAFEKDCETLLQWMHPGKNVKVVRANPGDEGIDIYVGEIGVSPISVYQCKFFLSIDTAQKAQIAKSFKKALNSNVFTVAEWILCMPVEDFDIQQSIWWSKWKVEREEEYEIPVCLMNGGELISKMKYYGIYNDIFKINDSIKINEIHEKLVKSNGLYDKEKRVICNLPYPSLNKLFKGRDKHISDIKEKISSNGSRVVIHGLGAIGKTRLAVEYGWRYKNKYNHIFFIIANSSEALFTNLADLCNPLVLNLSEYNQCKQEVKYNAVIRWLQTHREWLLILDNLDTIEVAQEAEKLFPNFQNGSLLITSRLSEWNKQIQCLQLDVLEHESAVEFVLDRTSNRRKVLPTDAVDSGVLAKELGYLPLALEQASAYVEVKRISLKEYYQRWLANRKDMREWSNHRFTDYKESISTTWQTSFDQLSKESQDLMNHLSWLSGEPIPSKLLEMSAVKTGFVDIEEAFADLVRYSLATYSDNYSAFSIHRMVQEVVREQILNETKQIVYENVLQWITTAFDYKPENTDNWSFLDALYPHALNILKYNNLLYASTVAVHLLNQIGRLLTAKAQPKEAEDTYLQALQIIESTYGLNHVLLVEVLNNLGLLMQIVNRVSEAKSYFVRAVKIAEDNYGADDIKLGASLNNLGGLLTRLEQYSEAELLLRRSLKIQINGYGSDNYQVATVLSNLGSLLKLIGNLDEAELMLRHALRNSEIKFGPSNSIVATRLNNIAAVLRANGKIDEAEKLYRRALKIKEDGYGAKHPEVAQSLNNLAWVLALPTFKRYKESQEFYLRAIDILVDYRQRTGYSFYKSTMILSNYCDLLILIGKKEADVTKFFQELQGKV